MRTKNYSLHKNVNETNHELWIRLDQEKLGLILQQCLKVYTHKNTITNIADKFSKPLRTADAQQKCTFQELGECAGRNKVPYDIKKVYKG